MNEQLVERIRKAMDNPKVRHLEDSEVCASLNGYIRQVMLANGQPQPNADVLTKLTSELASDLLDSYSSFTLCEVELCFDLGIRGHFGEVFGLKLTTFCQWLKSYQNSAERKEAKHLTAENVVKHAFSFAERTLNGMDELDYCRTVFVAYRAGKSLELFSPSLVYDILTRHDIISDSIETRHELLLSDAIKEDHDGRFGGYVNIEVRLARVKRYLLQQHFDDWIEQARQKESERAANNKD